MGEFLHNNSKIGGKIVSLITAVFVSDIEDFESRLLSLSAA